MEFHKGVQLTIKPTEAQKIKLEQHFGHNRYIWNVFLENRKVQYQSDGKGSTYFKDTKKLTDLKKELPWLFEVSTDSQQRTLKNLDSAYKNFYKKRAKFPKFKSKHDIQKFSIAHKINIEGKRIEIPFFREGLKFNRNLPEFKKINSAAIIKYPSGKYILSLSLVCDIQEMPKTGKEVGIDLGLIDFAVLDNGKRIKAPKLFRKASAELKRAQQHLGRKQKESKRREKQRVKVARIHEKIANSRKTFLHNTSAFIVRNFDFIGLEDLAVKNMVRNRRLSKSISDASWGEFNRQIDYKAKWYGKTVVKVDRFYPSSKTCNSCGRIIGKIDLSHRTWDCLCGITHDRDLNAAKNILVEAKRSARETSITNSEKAEDLK